MNSDEILGSVLAHAARLFDSEMRRALPQSGPRLAVWLKRVPLAEDGNASAALAPRSFPSFALPFWLTPEDRRGSDLDFHRDVAFSTLNGYYFIRLVDNITDNDGPPELRKLLPCAAYFLDRFQTPYQRYFPADHPFWTCFHNAWEEQAESSAVDLFLDDIDIAAFERTAARKFSAAKIPLAAAAFRYGREQLIDSWSSLVDKLGSFYQMVNDFFDWRRDLEFGVNTFFISEWRRRRFDGETMISWFAREGFALGRDALRTRVSDAIATARGLGSESVENWIRQRAVIFELECKKIADGFESLKRIAALIGN